MGVLEMVVLETDCWEFGKWESLSFGNGSLGIGKTSFGNGVLEI
jgi:hypothetical protein